MAGFLSGVRLPEDVERGAVGGPRFDTTVLSLDSGFEKRNVNWSQARGEWDIAYGLREMFDPDSNQVTALNEVQTLFYVVQGRGFSFRFKDHGDFEIAKEDGVDKDPQQIGLGDGTTTEFQVFKRYSDSGVNFDRTITKLVDGTVEVFVDGVAESGGHTVNNDTGVITFDTAPSGSGGTGPGGEELIAVRCEFDAHVRFDTDHLQLAMEIEVKGEIPSITLVEVRGTGL